MIYKGSLMLDRAWQVFVGLHKCAIRALEVFFQQGSKTILEVLDQGSIDSFQKLVIIDQGLASRDWA